MLRNMFREFKTGQIVYIGKDRFEYRIVAKKHDGTFLLRAKVLRGNRYVEATNKELRKVAYTKGKRK